MLNSFTSSVDTAYLISKPFDFSNNAGTNTNFSFWVYRDAGYPGVNDRLEVFWSGVSPGPGATLTPINHQGGSNVIPRLTSSFPTAINGAGWYEFEFTLPAATYNAKRNYFVIKGISALGNNMYLDNFTVNTYPTAMLATDVQIRCSATKRSYNFTRRYEPMDFRSTMRSSRKLWLWSINSSGGE